MQSLEVIAQDVAASFGELVDLTDPAARERPLGPVGVLPPDSTFGLAAKINRVTNHLRMLQAAVDRVTRRAGRRLAKDPRSAAPGPGVTLH